MKINRFWIVLLTVCLLLCAVVPVAVLASQEVVIGDFTVTGLPREILGLDTGKPLTLNMPEGIDYECHWFSYDGEYYNRFDGVAEKGGKYELEISMRTQEGYVFSGDAEVFCDLDETIPYLSSAGGYVANEDLALMYVYYDMQETLPSLQLFGLEQPLEGQIPSVEKLAVPQGVDYALESARWVWYEADGNPIPVQDPFVGGRYYALELDLALPAGYKVTGDTELILENALDIANYAGYRDVLRIYFFVPGTPITTVSASGAPDVQPGKAITAPELTVSADSHCTAETYWMVEENGDWVYAEGVFEQGRFYRLFVTFYPLEGYYMDIQEAYIDGQPANLYGWNYEFAEVYTLYLLAEPINQPELLGFRAPAVGMPITTEGISVPEDANYYISECYWEDCKTGEPVSGVFALGGEYGITVILKPKPGYYFPESTDLRIAGVTEGSYSISLTSLWYYGYFPLQQEVETVSIAGIPLDIVGVDANKPLDLQVPEGVTYECYWFDGLENSDTPYTGILRKGGQYRLYIALYPAEGYTFGEKEQEVFLDIDSEAPYVEQAYGWVEGRETAVAYVDYDLNDPLPGICIEGVEVPKEGNLPTTDGITAYWDVPYAIRSAQWYREDGKGDRIPVSGAFEGGAHYYLELALDLPEGYIMTWETELNLLGEFEYYDCYLERNVMILGFFVPGISVENIAAYGAPQAILPGQMISAPQITLSADSHCTAQAYWEVWEQDCWQLAEGLFQNNKIYRLNVDFTPERGYQLELREITMNGQSQNYYGGGYTHAALELMYPLTQEISRIDVLGVAEAVAGGAAAPEAIRVPENANYRILYAYWMDYETDETVEGSFEKGKRYNFSMDLVPNEGYHFAEDAVVTVNGAVWQNFELSINTVWCNKYYDLRETVENIHITGIGTPVLGAVPLDFQAENCIITYAAWVDANYEPVTKLEDKQAYYLRLELEPAPGYCFAGDATRITADTDMQELYQYASDEYASIEFYCTFRDLITSLQMKPPQVAVGQPIPRDIVPENKQYTTELLWFELDEAGETVETEDKVFQNGKMYWLSIDIYPENGYEFAPDVAIAGADADWLINQSAQNIYMIGVYALNPSKLIEKLEMTMPAPYAGMPAEPYEITWDSENYEMGVYWLEGTPEDYKEGDYYYPETLVEGQHYMLEVNAAPKNGYVISPEVSLWINGREVQVVMGQNIGVYASFIIDYGMIGQEENSLKGDFNGDGDVNNNDVTLLLWHTLFPNDYPIENGDLNGDGDVNNHDVVLLLWHTLFPEEYPM